MEYGGWGGELPKEATNVLLSSPAMDPVANEVGAGLLTKEADPSELAVMVVTYRDTAEEVLTDLREHLGREPAAVTIVSIGERQRLGDEAGIETGSQSEMNGIPGSETPPGTPTVETIKSPSDLTSLGIVVNERLVEWDQERWNPGPSALAVCYDSVTALLQHVDERRAYRFLHILTRRIVDASVTAHFHIDPAAHDRQTVSLLESLFDAIVEVSDEGTLAVRHR